MKRGTFAKRLGYEVMRACRIPFYNQKHNTVISKKTGLIRTKYVSSVKEFMKYFNIEVKPQAPHAKELQEALHAMSIRASGGISTSSIPNSNKTDSKTNPFSGK